MVSSLSWLGCVEQQVPSEAEEDKEECLPSINDTSSSFASATTEPTRFGS